MERWTSGKLTEAAARRHPVSEGAVLSPAPFIEWQSQLLGGAGLVAGALTCSIGYTVARWTVNTILRIVSPECLGRNRTAPQNRRSTRARRKCKPRRCAERGTSTP